jgi:hypothetical protein
MASVRAGVNSAVTRPCPSGREGAAARRYSYVQERVFSKGLSNVVRQGDQKVGC